MGLPPQVRGERRRGAGGAGRSRLTPAGAGRTCGDVTGLAQGRAYPRRCGENEAVRCAVAVQAGLPPQVRGEHQLRSRCGGPGGLTPAGAGRTTSAFGAERLAEAYPRRCGENPWRCPRCWRRCGLPPQVRGELRGDPNHTSAPGLTPAGAGRTWNSCTISHATRAYPRRCGENLPPRSRRPQPLGLPPQVRGERHH